MSLFRDTLRPPSIASDEAVRRYVEALRPSLDPDPLFRRRLRGVVVNRFVATREGIAPPDRTAVRGRAMGRIGRASLYASVMLAASVGTAMAASQAALPGDLLYSLKRQVETLRWQALPAQFHDELAIYVLTERVNELGQLAEAGRWVEAATLAGPIGDAYQLVEETGGAAADGVVGARKETLNAILARLPERAQAAVAQAMGNAPGLTSEPGSTEGASASGGGDGNGSTAGSTNDGGGNDDDTTAGGSNSNGGGNDGGPNQGGDPSHEPAKQGGDQVGGPDDDGKKAQDDSKKVPIDRPPPAGPPQEEASPSASP